MILKEMLLLWGTLNSIDIDAENSEIELSIPDAKSDGCKVIVPSTGQVITKSNLVWILVKENRTERVSSDRLLRVQGSNSQWLVPDPNAHSITCNSTIAVICDESGIEERKTKRTVWIGRLVKDHWKQCWIH